MGVAVQSQPGGRDFRVDLAAGDCESDFIPRYAAVPLAPGAANPAGAECVFRRVRGLDARLAGAVGGAAAARPDRRATQA